MIFLNGWTLAPHCWRTYLTRPVRIERVPGMWTCVSLFGFALFFEDRGRIPAGNASNSNGEGPLSDFYDDRVSTPYPSSQNAKKWRFFGHGGEAP